MSCSKIEAMNLKYKVYKHAHIVRLNYSSTIADLLPLILYSATPNNHNSNDQNRNQTGHEKGQGISTYS